MQPFKNTFESEDHSLGITTLEENRSLFSKIVRKGGLTESVSSVKPGA